MNFREFVLGDSPLCALGVLSVSTRFPSSTFPAHIFQGAPHAHQ